MHSAAKFVVNIPCVCVCVAGWVGFCCLTDTVIVYGSVMLPV